MQTLYLTNQEKVALDAITDDIKGLKVVEALSYHGDLILTDDGVAAEKGRVRLTANGGRDSVLTVCISPDVYFLLSNVAFTKDITILKKLLGLGVSVGDQLPVALRPCRFVGPPKRRAVAKGDTIPFDMDTLVPGKDVTVTALDSNDVVLDDPAPETVTADSEGLAGVKMLIPADYAGGNKIKFKIDKDVMAVDEFATGEPATAINDDSEIHELTVT